MCFHSRTPLIFNMGQKPKGSTELKVYYELTFVTLGHLQELVWSFTFFSTSDPISAHILNILHWFLTERCLWVFLRVLNHCYITEGQLKSSIDHYMVHPQFALERPHFNQNVITYLCNIFFIHCCMCTVNILMNWGNLMSSYDLSKIHVNCTH
jgi:hypothetical protein